MRKDINAYNARILRRVLQHYPIDLEYARLTSA